MMRVHGVLRRQLGPGHGAAWLHREEHALLRAFGMRLGGCGEVMGRGKVVARPEPDCRPCSPGSKFHPSHEHSGCQSLMYWHCSARCLADAAHMQLYIAVHARTGTYSALAAQHQWTCHSWWCWLRLGLSACQHGGVLVGAATVSRAAAVTQHAELVCKLVWSLAHCRHC